MIDWLLPSIGMALAAFALGMTLGRRTGWNAGYVDGGAEAHRYTPYQVHVLTYAEGGVEIEGAGETVMGAWSQLLAAWHAAHEGKPPHSLPWHDDQVLGRRTMLVDPDNSWILTDDKRRPPMTDTAAP